MLLGTPVLRLVLLLVPPRFDLGVVLLTVVTEVLLHVRIVRVQQVVQEFLLLLFFLVLQLFSGLALNHAGGEVHEIHELDVAFGAVQIHYSLLRLTGCLLLRMERGES